MTTDSKALFIQQDANECWTEVMRMLQQKLPGLKPAATRGEEDATKSADGRKFIDQFFGITSFHC